jgi:hypothetical protein
MCPTQYEGIRGKDTRQGYEAGIRGRNKRIRGRDKKQGYEAGIDAGNRGKDTRQEYSISRRLKQT